MSKVKKVNYFSEARKFESLPDEVQDFLKSAGLARLVRGVGLGTKDDHSVRITDDVPLNAKFLSSMKKLKLFKVSFGSFKDDPTIVFTEK